MEKRRRRRRRPKDKAYNQCALFTIFFDFFQGAIDIFWTDQRSIPRIEPVPLTIEQ
jgi:hypothetical protein